MAEKKEHVAGVANPNRGIPTKLNVAEIGANCRDKYVVEIGSCSTMKIPQEIRDSEIPTYPGGTRFAIKEGDEKGE